MMIGELEYESNFTWDAVSKSKTFVSTEILYLMFLGLGTVVIMNLLIGLTVSRTEELLSQAGVLRLKRTAEEVTTTEGVTETEFDESSNSKSKSAGVNFGLGL